MRKYKEINRIIKNYICLKYNENNAYRKDGDEFKQYLCDLMDIFKKNEFILEYSVTTNDAWEVPGFLRFKLFYSIDAPDKIFAMDFAI